MSKRNERDAEQSPNKWWIGEVMETARMLYALKPFPPYEKGKLASLASAAYEFLNNLHKACTLVEQQQRGLDANVERTTIVEMEAAKLTDPTQFDRAATFVIRDSHKKRARPKFEELLRLTAPDYGCKTKRQVSALMKRWRKDGVPLDKVIELRLKHDDETRTAREQRQRERGKKRKRKPRGARLP